MAKNWKAWIELLYRDGEQKKLKSLEILDIFKVSIDMKKAGVEPDFIVKTTIEAVTRDNLKVYLLMKIWKEQDSEKERSEVLAEIRKQLSGRKETKSIYVSFDNLSLIEEHILEFKNGLRMEIDKQGGIREICAKSANGSYPLNESSLSRFLRYNSKPTASYMVKIKSALGIEGLEVKT